MPRVKMTPLVKWSLIFLEIYLVVLFGLLVVRFFRAFAG
jgi:hypothetical protein